MSVTKMAKTNILKLSPTHFIQTFVTNIDIDVLDDCPFVIADSERKAKVLGQVVGKD